MSSTRRCRSPSRGLRRHCVVDELTERLADVPGLVPRLARKLVALIGELNGQINCQCSGDTCPTPRSARFAPMMTLAQVPQGCSSKVSTLSGGEGSCSEVAAHGLPGRVGAGVMAA
jgi:hypothetical protein